MHVWPGYGQALSFMSATVCLYVQHRRPFEGGYLWVFLNWAAGLRALGCKVVWLEGFSPGEARARPIPDELALEHVLSPYGPGDSVAACSWSESSPGLVLEHIEPSTIDVLLNIGQYAIPAAVLARFRRSALVDIDPGLLQTWMSRDPEWVPRHDVYFTIGETVGLPGARFPDADIDWIHCPPCVALDWWTPHPTPPGAPFTTVSHWWGDYVLEDGLMYANDKRTGFAPFLDLPKLTQQPLELALCLGPEETETELLQGRGWRVREADTVTRTPRDYQRYIQASRGEFSCAKPSCLRLQNAWISDRTLCYLASGKPVVVQDTGPSRLLPDAAGLFRFRDLAGAVRCLEMVAADYEQQCALARALVVEHFDARHVVKRVLERMLS